MATVKLADGTTLTIPDEGSVFRDVGDNTGSSLYTIQGGKLVSQAKNTKTALTSFRDNGSGRTYNVGDAVEGDPRDTTFLDPNYRGLATSTMNASANYDTQYGGGSYSKLATANVADIQLALSKGAPLGQNYAAPQDTSVAGYPNPNKVDQNGNFQGGTQPSNNAPAAPATQADAQIPPPPTVNLQPGNTGPAVKQLQDYLVSLGLMTPEQVATGPGIYGPQTTAAVKALQEKLGVDNSSGPGVYGPRTQSALASSASSQNQSSSGTGGATAGDAPVSSAPAAQTSEGTTNPAKIFQETYTQLVKDAGLMDIKASYQKFIDDEIAVQKELAGKVAEVNNNPWLSEGVRVKEIEKLNAKYKVELDSITNKANYMEALYKDGLDQVQFLATGIEKSQQDAMDNAQKKLDAEAKLAETNSTIVEADGRKYLVTYDTKGNLKNQVDIGKSNSGDGSGLSSAQINSTVNQIAQAFDNEPTVKDYNAGTTQYQLMSQLGTKGKNPGDDIAFIYAFAKLMDPASVVREGEYATIQKYAQSFLSKAELDAVRLVKNSNFLSTDAKQNLLNVAKSKQTIMESQYNNTYSQYQNRIDQAKSGGYNSLTDYSKTNFAPPAGSSQPASSQPTTITKDHVMYAVDPNTGELTPIGSAL